MSDTKAHLSEENTGAAKPQDFNARLDRLLATLPKAPAIPLEAMTRAAIYDAD